MHLNHLGKTHIRKVSVLGVEPLWSGYPPPPIELSGFIARKWSKMDRKCINILVNLNFKYLAKIIHHHFRLIDIDQQLLIFLVSHEVLVIFFLSYNFLLSCSEGLTPLPLSGPTLKTFVCVYSSVAFYLKFIYQIEEKFSSQGWDKATVLREECLHLAD